MENKQEKSNWDNKKQTKTKMKIQFLSQENKTTLTSRVHASEYSS